MDHLSRSRYLCANKRLNVYMPLVHPMRTSGVAKTLRLNGHLLFLDGPTSVTAHPRAATIASDEAKAKWGDNVHCYEGEEIFENLPDVIVNGWEDLETQIFDVRDKISSIKPVVLCAMSGNFQSAFDWTRYDGAICTDAPSRALARYSNVPTIRYFELFDPDDYPALHWDQNHILLPTFVNLFAKRFPVASAFHEVCAEALRQRFGARVIALVVDGVPNQEVRRLIEESAALLHIKDQEGYGWSILEALSSGRPIIYQAGLSRKMTFHTWIKDGISGFSFVTPDDLVRIAEHFLDNPEWVRQIQTTTAEIFRERYDGLETSQDLNAFLEDLMRIERSKWAPKKQADSIRRSAQGYQPTLNPDFVQDWEHLTAV